MSDDYFTRAFRPLLPDVRHITFNHLPDLVHITRRTAGVILETVRAESGIHRPDAGYLEAVAARCREVGALLILDEIQAGYGRTGTLWAFEQYAGVVPDVLLLAKGMGGGMPLGAFVASQEAMQTLTHDPVLGHITTFGGHPVSVAAGVATLETIVALLADPAHRQRMATLEAKIKTTLQHPAIVAVRTAGLWAAVELGSEAAVQSVIHYALERGVITDWFLFNARALRIAPPLTISEAEFDYGLTVLREGIERLPTAI